MSTRRPGRLPWFRAALDVVATIAMLVVAVVMLVMITRAPTVPPGAPSAPPLEVPEEPIPFRSAQTLGSMAASIGILEFADFECPFCARFRTETYPQLVRKYVDTGLVRFGFRHLPLGIHPRAEPAATAAACAAEQGSFWAMHDELFAVDGVLDDQVLARMARRVVPDTDRYEACVVGQGPTVVDDDRALAAALGLTGTPTFLIGHLDESGSLRVTEVIGGARPVDEFEAVIDELLAMSGE